MRVAPRIVLNDDERKTLTKWARGRSTPVRLVERAKIVLAAAAGQRNEDIATDLGIPRKRVGRWRSRFGAEGLKGIEKDRPRGGRYASARESIEPEVIKKTTQGRPANATHWSTRTLAKELCCTQSMVHRIWKANGLKPHLVRTFKISNDPRFEEKLRDVVGLYLSPPDKALVLSVDEKTSIQALDRTQPGLPLVKGRCGTMTHDYKRNGTTTLFAAIELLHGEVIAECMPRHRHQEWIKFLKIIDEQTPIDLGLHLIIDNYSAHKHPAVQRWLKRHRRFHVHYVPTSSSWLNIVEHFFRQLSERRLKRGVFRNIDDLIAAIMAYVQAHNAEPRPFIWTAKVDEILVKIGRAKAARQKGQTA